ncbi:MAG: transporter, partial [Cyanobium sp.]
MPELVGLFIALTLFSTMLALGLSLRLEALRAVLSQPALPLRLLLGSCVLVPLVGLLLLQTPLSVA